MRRFDYSFLKTIRIPTDYLYYTNRIYELRNTEEKNKQIYPDVFTFLQKMAIVQSVKSSNAIEGIITTDKRIEEIVHHSSAPLNHSEREIAGYRDALNLIHANSDTLSISEDLILHLHLILLSQTEISELGQYKQEDNAIIKTSQDGTARIRWMPVPANETPLAMQQLMYAYYAARNDAGINQLLLIPCVILDFLCIHPFNDGNGRISRLMSLLLLYRNGFDISKYISFEEQVNLMKDEYYEALRQSSVGWHENNNDYLPFISHFLNCLYRCYNELDKRFLNQSLKKVSKKERIEHVLSNAFVPISKKEICEMLPDVSVTTIELVISQMVKSGQIKKIGTTKSARYIKSDGTVF